ncbi:hypothetical protein Agub_g14462 [Astrephomene gubernaculifera]|uniref:Uncharacterized protein n=1 Tax=Astrephomene gubernaculifera TaxID=47775 RepID=A0AAD3E1F8_9CHLO|nr:hypothetical protein Agub_g14462 [Astrephomene gubernaculifera]
MRARTPPWQKAEQSQWEGQWAKLTQRSGRGNLDVVWDLADTAARVQAVRQRRADRLTASAPPLPAAAATTSPTAGSDGSSPSPSRCGSPSRLDPLTQPYDPATQPLPAAVVTQLLLQRYVDKYARMGLLDHLPLRAAAEAAALLGGAQGQGGQGQGGPQQGGLPGGGLPGGQVLPEQAQMRLWQQQQHFQLLQQQR